MKQVIVGLLLVGWLTCDAAPPSSPPLVLAENRYSYTFGTPEGWDFSFEQAQQVGLRLVFFPEGGNFDNSKTIIYVNELCGNGCPGFDAVIDRVIREAHEFNPSLQVQAIEPIPIVGGSLAQVRVLTGAQDPRQAKEALAFIDDKGLYLLVVLTTKDPKSWDKDYASFREVVSRHRYFDCDSPDLAVPCR